jgi:hypothetical protein
MEESRKRMEAGILSSFFFLMETEYSSPLSALTPLAYYHAGLVEGFYNLVASQGHRDLRHQHIWQA